MKHGVQIQYSRICRVFSTETKQSLNNAHEDHYNRPFPFLSDWLHGLSDQLTILLCSTAVLVSVLD